MFHQALQVESDLCFNTDPSQGSSIQALTSPDPWACGDHTPCLKPRPLLPLQLGHPWDLHTRLPALSYTPCVSYMSHVYPSQMAHAVCWGTRILLLRTPPSPGLAHQGDQRTPGALGELTDSAPGPGKPCYSNLSAHGGLKKYLVASSSSPGRPSQVGLTPHPALLPHFGTLIIKSHRRVDD